MSLNNNNMASCSLISQDDDKKNIKMEHIDSSDYNGDENRSDPCILEGVYQDKLADIQKELSKLQVGTHADYVKRLKTLEKSQNEKLMKNNLSRDHMIESIERDYAKECRQAFKEFQDRCNELNETLINQLNEQKKTLEEEMSALELVPDCKKPAVTRKLRRRPNDPMVPVPQVRRRTTPSVSSIKYMLNQNEIEQDVKAIKESLASIPSTSNSAIRQPGGLSSNLSSGNMSPEGSYDSDTEGSPTILATRIESGKLLFEKIWYHRGQPIFVEGIQMAKFPAVITAIGNETVWVKKTLDNTKVRIKLSHLIKGKTSIKRRAVV